MKRVAIYLRVSTSKQETSNQRRELEAVASRSGWEIIKVYEDAGISGAKGRDQRPGLDAMLKAVNSKEFDLVLLRHKFLRTRRAVEARQHGHRGKRLTRASMMRRRTVAIEFGT
jgi:DNA invertase Pin-like site-specific DNA recombinase